MLIRRADFATWMACVEQELERIAGVCSDDIEDWCYHDAFDDGSSPYTAAVEALENAGWL